MNPVLSESIRGLLEAYRSGATNPRQHLHQLRDEAAADTHRAWIRLLTPDELDAMLDELEKMPRDLPLYGVPFGIKDNIDLAAIPTSAGCPAFTYTPVESARVVQNLMRAGAIPLGKTNLDQFATGLVGTRSPEPWGPCRNAINPRMISGGSSAGSAVATALGQVLFALGTDTAGSGRVPAMFNRLVGVKPSRGLISNKGMVPACASLDCVSIFARNCWDANQVFDCAVAHNPDDPWSRHNRFENGARYFSPSTASFRFGVPQPSQLAFFGDDSAAFQFECSRKALEAIGGIAVELDFEPLLQAARLLYQGPWIAERYLAMRSLIETKPESIHPVVRQIVEPARDLDALGVFEAQYQLQALRQGAERILDQVDLLVTPTAGTCYSIDAVLANPVQLNTNLGYYTNYLNLLDMAAVAVPTGYLASGVGFGISLIHRAFEDKRLLSLAARLEAYLMGTDLPAQADAGRVPPKNTIDLVVCGAHLHDQPLAWQLRERGAQWLGATQTAPGYRLFALAGGGVQRPALVRDGSVSSCIEVEIWRVPSASFASFAEAIPGPLGLGKTRLADGRELTGFICEANGLEGATEITDFGGWRAWMARSSAS